MFVAIACVCANVARAQQPVDAETIKKELEKLGAEELGKGFIVLGPANFHGEETLVDLIPVTEGGSNVWVLFIARTGSIEIRYYIRNEKGQVVGEDGNVVTVPTGTNKPFKRALPAGRGALVSCVWARNYTNGDGEFSVIVPAVGK
jgi:hypothetical protein